MGTSVLQPCTCKQLACIMTRLLTAHSERRGPYPVLVLFHCGLAAPHLPMICRSPRAFKKSGDFTK